MSLTTEIVYLAALALLPWRWFPPFPWLHARAQWADVAILLAAATWTLDLWRERRWPRLAPAHAAMGLYLVWAALSLVMRQGETSVNAWKLLGMAELVTLAAMTTDIAKRKGSYGRIQQVVAVTTLIAAASGIGGVILFLAGRATPLIGTYGDLLPGSYARAQAGFDHPNLLGSYCLFAWGLTSRGGTGVPAWLRRLVLGAVLVVMVLTFSRAILLLPVLVLAGRAVTPGRRRLALAFVAATAIAIALLTFVNLRLDPTRFWEAAVDSRPSPRRQALHTALGTLIAHPLLGSGPGTSPARVDGYAFDAHCTPLNVAATLGAPAFLAFVAIWPLLWRGRPRPTDRVLWGTLAAMALDGIAQDIEDFRHLWILFGLVAARDDFGDDVPHGATHASPLRPSGRRPHRITQSSGDTTRARPPERDHP